MPSDEVRSEFPQPSDHSESHHQHDPSTTPANDHSWTTPGSTTTNFTPQVSGTNRLDAVTPVEYDMKTQMLQTKAGQASGGQAVPRRYRQVRPELACTATA